MRVPATTPLLSVMFFCCMAFVAGTALAEEKAMTPLAGGIPMIEGIKMLEVGTAAPDFSVKDSDGKPFRLSEEKGKKAFLLVFWSIFCEPCRAEMPVIQKMHEKYRESGLNVVTIALDGEPLVGSIAGFIRQEGYTFRVLIDELDSQEMFKVADPYGVAGTPTLFLLDRAGKVALARAGRLTDEELEKAIQAVLKK
ncbi:MAG: TlpA family protein disulfide reductase [Deltaproteobacteria bacterium]|nr:TlpA family protein disulfide reductase [Deltaproteobacteria bacterium]